MKGPSTLKMSTENPPQGGWFVRAFGDGFLDARNNNLSDRARWVFQVLDCRAARDAFCYPSNEWIRERTGKKDSALVEIFAELEKAGWIQRVYTDATRRERIGFIFLKRVDPETPSAEGTPEGIDRATKMMIEAIAQRDGRSSPSRPRVLPGIRQQELACCRESGNGVAGNPATRVAGNPAAYRDSVEEDSKTKTKTAESSSSSLEDQTPEGEGDPRVIQAVERIPKMLHGDGDTIASKTSQACKDFGVDEVLKTLAIVEIRSKGQPKTYGWPYFLKTLKNGRDEGGLIVPSIARSDVPPVTVYNQGAERQRLLRQALINSGRANP